MKNEQQIIKNQIAFIEGCFGNYAKYIKVEHLNILVNDDERETHNEYRITNTTNDKFTNVNLSSDESDIIMSTELGEDMVEIDELEFMQILFVQQFLTFPA